MSLEDFLGTNPRFLFSGVAGKLQQESDRRGLIAELATNYGIYHDQLRVAWDARNVAAESIRAAPGPLDVVAYSRAGGSLDAVLEAEGVLRVALQATGRAPSSVEEAFVNRDYSLRAMGTPASEQARIVASGPVPTPAPLPNWAGADGGSAAS